MDTLEKIYNSFYEDGFVVVRKLLMKKEIKEIKKEFTKIKIKSLKIKNPHIHFTKNKKINTIHNINRYIKKGRIINLLKDKKIKSIVKKILNDDFDVRNIEFFLKPKKSGFAAPYHQDNYYWNIKNKKALNLWIACSQANKNNGGVSYYIGSHKNGLKLHKTSYVAGSSYKIDKNILSKIKSKKIYPDLKPGDAIFHHCEVIHGSGHNKSETNREGLVVSFKAKSAKINKVKLKKYLNNVKKNLNYLKFKNIN